jgi:hypothetical protein
LRWKSESQGNQTKPHTIDTRKGTAGKILMHESGPEHEYLKHVFEDTQVLRRPITGIVSGYHNLPYILVGPDEDHTQRSVEIRGSIRVSPRLVISPRHTGQTYGELFDDPALMDRTLVARAFSFLYSARHNVQLESDDLRITKLERDPRSQIERTLDELMRGEVLDTGVILSPDVKFYPVSIERFIAEILDREFPHI